MRNSRIRYLLTIWVILFVSIFTCNAQQIDTVYMNKIASSFKQITNLPQEKVYLHTDKPYYFVGDTIWLKAYLVNAITHFSGNGSQYVYVELINRKDKVLQRIKIQQDKDLFASYLTLPKTLEAGDYYLRAYTHWMLNEDSSFYFSKNLKILASQSSFMYPEIRYEQKGKKRTAIITFKRPDNGVYAGNYVHYMVRTKTHENKFRQQQTNKNGEIQIDIPEKEEIEQYIYVVLEDKQLKYKHNDMADLEKQLQKCNPDSVKLIIVDGVFSMEGDLANLPEIVRLKHKYNATIMVDEAHGLGVFGKQGRGVCDHFGLTHEVDLIMGTFSKSLASIGGFIAADSSIINWLRHNARTYIFSASNTPAATASALEALHIIQNEPERLEALWEATNYALKRFREAGFEIGATESPIIPLYVRDTEKTFMVTKLAFDEGVFINPVIPPACAPQDTLVRVALMATHTKDQIDRAVEKLVKAFKALDLL